MKYDAKDDLIVVIPAYEPPKNFVEYVKEVAALAKAVVVVNDGSGEEFAPVFNEISAVAGVHYLTYEENQGKGFALKYAFKFCLETFSPSDIIVTADCDGQHAVRDVMRVYGASREHNSAIILGSRNFDKPNVPKKSKSGNRSIRRIFKFFYGIDLYDTQTGLRGFPVSVCPSLIKVRGKRFEYEMGMLIWAKKHGVDILEIPIETIYDSVDNHSTHYRPIVDSLKIFWVVIRNFGLYLLSGMISGLVDVAAFYVLSAYLLTSLFPESDWLLHLVATASARVISSVVNFALNYKYVFNGASKSSFVKYYILWGLQLGASFGLSGFVKMFFGLNELVTTVAKFVIDLLLGMLSYQIQNAWVFKRKKKGKIYGPLARFARFLVRRFTKTYRCDVLPYNEPVMYVCRHLNMKGAAATLGYFKFQVHPLILSVFFTEKECYRQYADYTFTVRQGKKKKKFNFKAWFLSRLAPKGIRSAKGVPVYRDFTKMKQTFDIALDYLKKGESLIVYPDIEYTAGGDKVSDIYDGFLFLSELYRMSTGKDLRFVPVHINEEERILEEKEAAVIKNFRTDRKPTAEYLKYAINGLPVPQKTEEGCFEEKLLKLNRLRYQPTDSEASPRD